MSMRLLPAVLLSLILTSCWGNARKSVDSNAADSVSLQSPQSKADTTAGTDCDAEQNTEQDREEQLTPVSPDAIKPLLDKEKQMRAALTEQLKRSTPQQADSIYRSDGYLFQNTEEFTVLTAKTLTLIERVGDCGGDLLPGDSTVIRMLHESGCEIFYQGEGYAELGAGQYYYYDIFKPYLSEPTRRFAELQTYNDTQLFADAGLIEPTDSLYARCLRWEEYTDDYPESPYASQISEEYKLYMQNILFCHMDNTATFEGSWIDDKYVLGRIYDYNLEEIRSLEKTGRGTKTNRIVAQYLDELGNQDYRYSKELEERILALCGWMDKSAPDKRANDE